MSDLISRQAAIDALNGLCDRECEYSKEQRYVMCGACHLGSAFDVIEQLPSAEPKHGKWIRNNTYHGDDTSGYVDPDWTCSECGKNAIVNPWMMYDLTNFCPNCGAKMEADHDSD